MIVERSKSGGYTAFHKKYGRPCVADMPTAYEAIVECWLLVSAIEVPKEIASAYDWCEAHRNIHAMNR